MDTLYAITLMVAIAAAVIAILASLLPLIRTDKNSRPGARASRILLPHRLANFALALGVFSLTASVFVHSRWGHGADTVAPMGFGRLLAEHEAFPTVGAMLLLASVLAVYGNRRRRHGSAT